MAAILRPRGCILISSVQNPHQLPPWFRLWRPVPRRAVEAILKLTGRLSAKVPKRFANKSTVRLTKLHGEAGRWHRWATAAVLSWKPEAVDVPILHIHGDSDATFPHRFMQPDCLIRSGTHNLCTTHAAEVVDSISNFISKLSNNKP